ncbi:hypothetical protein GCM10023074_10240 [Microbispora amethystogenes]|uniref:Uncharacterized protein n=1 Tax=Microbispora amethystogenes TaxID=1427754 RepID=A0ABQ4FIG8_9ACTN|nr:hypothetical protein Mam01_47880 [Microbispora amethystogenes]
MRRAASCGQPRVFSVAPRGARTGPRPAPGTAPEPSPWAEAGSVAGAEARPEIAPDASSGVRADPWADLGVEVLSSSATSAPSACAPDSPVLSGVSGPALSVLPSSLPLVAR